MITYRAPGYVRRSLPRLLDDCGDDSRVWLWHNGDHAETLEIVREYVGHPKVAEFHHSVENVGLTEPTNWMWQHSEGDYLSKVDDDCLLAPGWAERLIAAHDDFAGFGVVGSWRFQDEDYDPALSEPKTKTFPGGHTVLQNFWVQGSGYVMRRECVERLGPLAAGQSFPQYCISVALAGWTNGWYVPFVIEDHMDDPRSPNTCLHTDADLRDRLPLSARRQGITTLVEWEASIKRSAYESQAAPPDPRYFTGWRLRQRRLGRRLGRLTGKGRAW